MGIGDTMKTVKDLVVSVHDAELKSALLEKLLDVQLHADALLAEKRDLKDEIATLKDISEREQHFEVDKASGVTIDKSQGGSYICTVCWQNDHKIIPVVQYAKTNQRGICVNAKCKASYPNLFEDEELGIAIVERG